MDNTLFMFAIALILSVIVHEVGHLAAFRLFGGRVEEVALGFGPTLVKKKWGNCLFSLRLFPLGGFVRPNDKDFQKATYFQKMVFFSAGIGMNFAVYFVSFGLASISHGKSFINGLVVATDGLIHIVSHIKEIFQSMSIDMIFGSSGSIESQVQMINEIGNNVEFLLILAIINISIIALNILPIPSLDGGRIILTSIEHLLIVLGVSKSRIENVTNPLYIVSYLLLMGLIFIQIITANTFQLLEDVKMFQESHGLSTIEIILWISLLITIVMNIIIFLTNRFSKTREI